MCTQTGILISKGAMKYLVLGFMGDTMKERYQRAEKDSRFHRPSAYFPSHVRYPP